MATNINNYYFSEADIFDDYTYSTAILENDQVCTWQDCSQAIDSISEIPLPLPTPFFDTSAENFKEASLIHLLIAAAEAVLGGTHTHDLARIVLNRLEELVSYTGRTSLERLGTHFVDALQGLRQNGPQIYIRVDHDRTHVLGAFRALQDTSPYVTFGHLAANQAILEAVAFEKKIHIVDYDIMEGVQWSSFMQSLASRKGGPRAPHLRITAISRGRPEHRPISTAQETGRRLIEFASSIDFSFSFHILKLGYNGIFRPSDLKLVTGEVLVFNCMLHLPYFSYRPPDSIASFLSGAKNLNPRLITLVEEEMGSESENGFVGRFMGSLLHYSAIYNSLEVGISMQDRARELVERAFFGPKIVGSLARNRRWWEWLGGMGYSPVNISFANYYQAKLLLGLYCDGYSVEELAKNKLVLGWKSQNLLSASFWTS